MLSSATVPYSVQYSTSSRTSYRPASLSERITAFIGHLEFPGLVSRFGVCTGLVVGPITYPELVRAQRHVECRDEVLVPLRSEPDPVLARVFRLPSAATTRGAGDRIIRPGTSEMEFTGFAPIIAIGSTSSSAG